MNETDFLANIARKLGRPTPSDRPTRDVTGAPDFWRESPLPTEGLTAKFHTELESLGGQVIVCARHSDMLDRLKAVLQELRPDKIGVWGGRFLEENDLEAVLETFPVVRWGEEVRGETFGGEEGAELAVETSSTRAGKNSRAAIEVFAHVDVSITGCAYAIADTGTIVMMNGGVRGRSTAVLPTVHIVILHESQIRHHMGEVLSELSYQRDNLPASVHFISGPSRSSDIENDQTIGIHGPAALRVFVLP